MSDKDNIRSKLLKNMNYELLFNVSADAIMITTPEEGFLAGNPATVKMFKCKDETEFVSQSPAALSPQYQPDGKTSSAKAQEMMAIAMDKGSHFFEWTHRKMDGEEFFADVLLTRFEIAGKKYLQATVRDLTQYKLIEQKLKEAAEEWDVTFNAISDLMFIADRDNNIVKVNKAFAAFFRRPAKELVGTKCFNIVHGRDKPWPQCPFEMTKKDFKAHSEEVIDPHIGLPLLITTSPIFNNKGEFIGIVHIAKDISKIKETEGELRKKIEDLERFQKVMIDRELKMKELKARITELETKVIKK